LKTMKMQESIIIKKDHEEDDEDSTNLARFG
jgi:hypothetical protein